MEQPLSAPEWWRPNVEPAVEPVAVDRPALPSAAAFRALIAFTIVLVAAPQAYIPGLSVIRPALLAAASATVAYLAGDRSGAAVVRRSRERVLAGALLAWALVTVPFSLWPGGSIKTLLDPYLQSLVLFWLVSALTVDEQRLRTLVATLSWCSVPLAFTALRHFSSGQIMAGGGDRIEGYASGLAGNPNDLALMLVIILPMTAALCSLTRTTMMRFALFGVLLLQAAAIVATFSRSGFVALVVVIGAGLLRLVRERSIGVLAGIAAAVFVAWFLVPASYVDRLSTIGDINSDPTGSAQARWADTLVAETIIADHPLVGAGIGSDYLALNQARGTTWKSVHDAYLQAGVDLGLLGLGLYVLLVGSSLLTARRAELAAERHGLDEVQPIASAVRIALVAFVVAAFFYPIAYHPYFYLLSGLAVATRGVTSHVEA